MVTNRLLILDDEAAIGTLVATVARKVGYEAEATTDFGSFREAFDRIEPTHVVLDLQLPDTDGVEVLSYLTARGANVRVLLMSGFDARVLDMVGQVARDRGFDVIATCRKPLRVPELRDILRRNAHEQPLALEPEALDQALDEGQIFVNFQPQCRLSDGVIVGFEALARWRHPDLDLIAPDKFIPLAERSGRIARLTHYVFDQATDAAVRFAACSPNCGVAVNVSPLDLSDPHLADKFAQVCRDKGVAPDKVTLEMTESAAMSDPVSAKEALVRLRLKGFRLSLDDFGTGYSSLVLLRQMPLSELKIDRSFVTDCTTSHDSEAIMEAVVAMAHALGLSVVAEGVETQEVLGRLAQADADLAQGYLMSRPVGLDEACRMLTGSGQMAQIS
ncbi:EAL domain-containing protein [Amorphus sp. 3PC139-8]|uniref:EAL domain-containing response regulator n=1 Tax=Amorphus sp. 3PC139-8 TaxID=2735676 RepID=UPI00345DD19A